MKEYLSIVKKVLENGAVKENRTGVNTIAIPGAIFEHEMSEGFPLLTTKKVPLRLPASEMEFFIKGLTDKKWLQERNNHIWDEWCSPEIVPYSHDPEIQENMKQERDLGPIYGWQWRHFGAKYQGYDKEPLGEGVDQLKELIKNIKENPNSRRLIVTAWNPVDLPRMGLPPCHYNFQVTIIGGKLNLIWSQRSVDVALGLPFNIAGYATVLHLLAKETGYKEGKLVGLLGDVHVYENHVDGLKEQLTREPRALPKIVTENFTSIFEWKHTDSKVIEYDPHPRIKFEVAV